MAKGETYEQFTEKFIPKRTTDDCYTPPQVYQALLQWVVSRGVDSYRHSALRPQTLTNNKLLLNTGQYCTKQGRVIYKASGYITRPITNEPPEAKTF